MLPIQPPSTSSPLDYLSKPPQNTIRRASNSTSRFPPPDEGWLTNFTGDLRRRRVARSLGKIAISDFSLDCLVRLPSPASSSPTCHKARQWLDTLPVCNASPPRSHHSTARPRPLFSITLATLFAARLPHPATPDAQAHDGRLSAALSPPRLHGPRALVARSGLRRRSLRSGMVRCTADSSGQAIGCLGEQHCHGPSTGEHVSRHVLRRVGPVPDDVRGQSHSKLSRGPLAC
ncbi:hypothetical protein V8C44DRAFT_175391 [Trichoderma aethiopicum]